MVYSVAEDARLRMLFEKMSQFWEPSVSKRKKTKAEREQDEEAAVPEEGFHPEDPSEEQDEHDKATIDAYMSVLQHRSPRAAEMDSLMHAAASSAEDEASLAQALGSGDKEPETPAACLKSGLTEDLQELALSTGKKQPDQAVSKAAIIELGDSPVPEAPSKPLRSHPGFSESARARLVQLQCLGLQGEGCMQSCAHTHIHADIDITHATILCNSQGRRFYDARLLEHVLAL